MANIIEFRLQCNTLSGHEIIAPIHGANGYTRYLGSELVNDIHYGVTEALREFNLPAAVAPGEWPNPHEQVTTDQDPRH